MTEICVLATRPSMSCGVSRCISVCAGTMIAVNAKPTANVDAIMSAASTHGWMPLYHDRYPHAGGPEHYAGWLENSAGAKAEIVADER